MRCALHRHEKVGCSGAEQDRTVGLLNAIQALSQLSYSPIPLAGFGVTTSRAREGQPPCGATASLDRAGRGGRLSASFRRPCRAGKAENPGESMATIDFGGVKEEVVTREEFPIKKALEVLKNETIAVIGYGVQGPAQSLNMKDNGFNVIIGQASQVQEGLGPRGRGRLGARQDAVRDRGSGREGHHHPDAGVGRGAEGDLARDQEAPEEGRRALLLARLLHRLPGPDRRDPAAPTST